MAYVADQQERDPWDDDPQDEGANAGDIEVHARKLPKTGWHWIPNELFKGGWAQKIGVYCLAVLYVLAYHAKYDNQTAFPSYEQMAEELGIGRSTVIEATKELLAWGMIHKETRRSKRGRTNNLYTLVDPAEWRREATFRNAKGLEITKKIEIRVQPGVKQTPAAAMKLPSEASSTLSAHGGIPGTPASIHGKPRVVRSADSGGPHGKPEQESVNNKNLRQESMNNNLNVCTASRSVSDRALLGLLCLVAPEFRGAERVVSNLSPERFDTIGAVVLYYLAKPGKHAKLTNPAGYFRSIMTDPSKNEDNIPGLPFDYHFDEYRSDWSQYSDLFRQVSGEGNSSTREVRKRFCCINKRYGLSYEWCTEILAESPCDSNRRDSYDDLDDDLDDDLYDDFDEGLDDDLDDLEQGLDDGDESIEIPF